MPFLGKSPTAGFASIVKDDLTPNGSTTAFTLSKPVASANDIAVFVGNVRQEPTDAYSVLGTTLTMTAAPASGLNFYVLHIVGTVESSVVPAAGTTVPGAFGVQGDLTVDTSTLKVDSINNRVGIGTTSADGKLHIFKSSAGTVTAATDANELVLESSANVGMSFLTANSSLARIKFGDADATNSGVISYNHVDDSLRFNTNGSERLRILSSGGITFNGDSATANALDDYEEGTFNVSGYTFSGGGTATITSQDNVYTKVGGLVVVSINLGLNFSAGCSGNITISGLPFTSTNHIYEAAMTYNNQSHGWVYDGNLFKGSGNTNLVWYGRSLNPSSISNFQQWFTTTYRTTQ